jgi:hypothetical protein
LESQKGASLSHEPVQHRFTPPPVTLQSKTGLADTISTEDRIRQLQEQIDVRQNDLQRYRNNPQLYLPDAGDSLYIQERKAQDPQGDGVSSVSSVLESEQVDAIYRQIRSLNAELQRLQARLEL